MSYNPQNPDGQATSANSSPVVIASDQSAVPISASSLPLPTGAATSTNLTGGGQKTQIVDGSGNVIGSTSNALNVDVTTGSVTANAGTNLNTSLLALESGGNLATLAGTVTSGKINVNFASGSLPSGSNTIGNVEITDGTNTANVNAVSGKNGLYVASNAATGSAVPAGAYYIGVLSSSGNLAGLQTAKSAGITGVSAESLLPITGYVYNGSTNERMVSAPTASGTAGVGLLGTGAMGIYNSSAPTANSGDYYQLQLDSAANLKVTSGNPTGSAVPPGANYLGVSNSSGNLTGLLTASGANVTASSTGTGGNNILPTVAVGQYLASGQTTAGSGDYQALQIDSASNLKVNVAATSGTLTVQPGNTPNTSPWLVSLNPSTSGGWSVSSQTALTNTIVYIKTSAGQFGGYMFFNPNSAVIYIQIFNAASGATLGVTTPTYVIPIPAAASANVEFANGIAHSAGIGVAATTTATGSVAPTTSLTGFFVYK